MRQEEIWDADAAESYGTRAPACSRPRCWGPMVDRLAGLVGDGRALEFAIGTGRVAVAPAARGVPVSGVELSRPMIAQLREG